MTAVTNLQFQLTTFVGRERELCDVVNMLDSARLLTLVGPGGIGKTRLSVRVAEAKLERFEDGVWLVELASTADPALVPLAMASTLGVRQRSAQSLSDALVSELRLKHALLVLDNCEHVVDAAASLADRLLRACPRLQILATSRQSLGVAGEAIWRVPSLPLPEAAATMGTDEIAASDAVRLFVDRARAAMPAFQLDDRNAASVAEICRRLDGIPLAIELAAARVGVLGLEQILQRLDDRLRLLTGGSRTAASRQQTLRATLDWSCDLLSQAERLVLDRLSVFAGGWTLEAAETVAAGSGVESADVLGVLSQLVDKSLVDADTQREEARFRLLETIRQYAHERLVGSGHVEATQARHAEFFLEFAEIAVPHFGGPGEAQWFDRLEADHDNLRAALRWLLDGRHIDASQRVGSALGWFWMVRGHRREGQGWLEQSVAEHSGASFAVRARAIEWLGRLADARSDYARATEAYTESLGLLRPLRELGAHRELAALLEDFGGVERRRGKYAQARALLDESLQLRRELGDQRGVALTLSRLGRVASDQGDNSVAESTYLESLHILKQLGDRHYVAHVQDILGVLARRRGAPERARRLHSANLVVFRELADKEGMADSLSFLARVAIDTADLERALGFAAESVGLYNDLECKWGLAESLETLAAALTAGGRARDAVRLLGASDALRESIGVPLPPADRSELERTRNTTRQLLQREWDAAWSDARALTLEQVVEHAHRAAAHRPASTAASAAPYGPQLTRREQDVARLIAEGHSNREISEALVISGRTAEAHVTHLLNKLGLRSRAQVAVWAARNNLLGAAAPMRHQLAQ